MTAVTTNCLRECDLSQSPRSGLLIVFITVVIDLLGFGIVLLGADRRVLAANLEAQTIFSQGRHDILGESVLELVFADGATQIVATDPTWRAAPIAVTTSPSWSAAT